MCIVLNTEIYITQHINNTLSLFHIFICAMFYRTHQTDANGFSAHGLGTGTTHHCYAHPVERRWDGNIISHNPNDKVIGNK